MSATIHNPVNFEPRDYVVEDYLDNRRPEYFGQSVDEWQREIADWEAEMLHTIGANWRAKIHHCVHCGNGMVRWITAVRHLPTNEVVVFGAVCTNRLGFADKHAFKLAQLQARAEARKVRFTIWNKRQEFLQTHPEIVDALAHISEPVHARNTFVQDVLAKLDRFGDLTDKQVDAVVKSMQRDREFAARRAAEQEEPKGNAPTGRVTVTGTVLSVKEYEGDWGVSLKMLVKLENNSRVWCTVPSGANVQHGDTITFKATFTPKEDDKSFAFGARPIFVKK